MADEPTQANFLELSIVGLTKRIEQIFGFNCDFVLGDYDRRAAAKTEGEIKYPYANLRVNQISRRQDGSNPTATRRFGFRTVIEQSGQYWYKFHGVPITLNLTLRMVFGDQQDLFQMIHHFFIRESHFNFTLEAAEGAFLIQHNVTIEPDISVPQFEESEYGLNIPFETNLKMNTWVGEIYQIPIIVTYKGEQVGVTRQNIDDIIVETEIVPGTEFLMKTNLAVNPLLGVKQN